MDASTGAGATFRYDGRVGVRKGDFRKEQPHQQPACSDRSSWIGSARRDVGLYYNVHRWYMPGTGLYDRPDPEWLESMGKSSGAPSQLFAYAESQPLTRADPLGLLSFHLGDSCRRLAPDRLSRLQQVVADAQENLGRVTACKQLVASEKSITIRCGQNCGGGCARYKPSGNLAGTRYSGLPVP